MGVIKRGILGGFSNRVGNVVGSSWKGIATMRVLPLSVANPRTAGQINVRENFKGIAQLASALLTSIVKPLNDRFAVRMSGYNLFVQRNRSAFQDDGTFKPEELSLSRGRLSEPVIETAVVQSPQSISVSWSSDLSGSMDLNSDLAYILVMGADGTVKGTSSGLSTRNSATASIVGVDFAVGDFAYLSFLRADGTEVSPSSYIDVE